MNFNADATVGKSVRFCVGSMPYATSQPRRKFVNWQKLIYRITRPVLQLVQFRGHLSVPLIKLYLLSLVSFACQTLTFHGTSEKCFLSCFGNMMTQ